MRPSLRSLLLGLLLLAAGSGCGPRSPTVVPRPDAGTPSVPAPSGPRYNEVTRVACHNCYDRDLFDSLRVPLRATRAIEIDIHRTGAPDGTWFVNHERSHNDNNCAPDPREGDLGACLGVVRQVVEADPAGGVVSVFVDLKDGWKGPWQPRGLDSLVRRVLPAEILHTPAEMRDPHPTLVRMAEANAWPHLATLQGKVLLVLTGPNPLLSAYLEQTGDSAAFFVAANATSSRDMDAPRKFAASVRQHVVFFNFDVIKPSANAEVRSDAFRRMRARQRVSRFWYPGEPKLELTDAIDASFRLTPCAYVRNGLSFLAAFRNLSPLPKPAACGAARKPDDPPAGTGK